MGKHILYGVLNWGLGHATRSIPIIHKLLLLGNTVTIASDSEALELLQLQFPNVHFIELPGYNARYSKTKLGFNTTILKQIPHFLNVIKEENRQVENILAKSEKENKPFDLIFSDNRYGFYHKSIPSYFIGHQLNLLFPANRLVEIAINNVHKKMLANFNKILIPDNKPPDSIAEKLHKTKLSHQYLGIFSRMKKLEIPKKYDVCVVLSGPEPQRSILEDVLISKLKSSEKNIIFIRGVFTHEPKPILWKNSQSKTINFCNSIELNEIICSSNLVICRSGYSSILDLIVLEKQAILIPTPGQPEQEYLAEKCRERNWFQTQKQHNFSLNSLENIDNYQVPSVNTQLSLEDI